MKKRLVYFALSLAAALAALVTQFSPPPAAAQRPLPDDPTEECRACDEGCTVTYEVCAAQSGRGRGFGLCVREMQECRRTCHGRGGPCDSRGDTTPGPTPSPTPAPTPD